MSHRLCPLTVPCWWQISGHVTDEEGKKRIALVGKWNSYLDMQKCDEEGTPLPGAQLVRLWTVHNQSINLHFVSSRLIRGGTDNAFCYRQCILLQTA